MENIKKQKYPQTKIINQIIPFIMILMISGCSTNKNTENSPDDINAKNFNINKPGFSKVYIYRDSNFPALEPFYIKINDQCMGNLSGYTYFYVELESDKTYTISSKSKTPKMVKSNSPNTKKMRKTMVDSYYTLKIKAESGKNYFIRQYLKTQPWFGNEGSTVLSGESGLELVEPEFGMKDISISHMATMKKCNL